ncbi:MAG: DNA alkylation repair protein [Candidatus Methanoperedens sp.]|nr:DNA alkylation repair protein [Candidatus Methanoperedens sp.]
MEIDEIITRLKSLSNPKSVEGMARYGINPEKTLGVSIPALRKMAKDIGRSHVLASGLWDTGIHEARILAGMIDEPDKVDDFQMEQWVRDFDSWDVCDQCCMNLFDRTGFAYHKAIEWSSREEEFVKRAGFALMAALAFHDKKAGDEAFLKFFPEIEKESVDERNYVKKAVNWALRQIGKRNIDLNMLAIQTAKNIRKIDSRSARWIAADALRELEGEAVQKRLQDKKTKS